jgi:hypothetical protein
MDIYKKDNKIIAEIPFWSKRSNPYMENENVGEYPTLIGLIHRHNKDGNDWDEIGFHYAIDMDYKDKPDQIGGPVIMWYGEEKDFIKKCKEFGIDYEIWDDKKGLF